uniref:Uncharacterized protein n=1 Tax=Nelumbo nucifera TaxID=4432 RepID=A0A822YG24_NELNU|nr:TPA_asm: hypothetical protein HUJ06_031403 [Nelumbo nucifera]
MFTVEVDDFAQSGGTHSHRRDLLHLHNAEFE